MIETLDKIRSEALAALRPPKRLNLADWVESNVNLPSSIAAQPGRLRLWPHQRALANSIGDPNVERVTVLKSVRIGYTQMLIAALGHYAINDPGPVLCVLPADQDCRHLMTSGIEPTFAESPTLRSALLADVTGRDTMLNRHFPGGSLALVSANSPRNLRARTARILFLDEVDGFNVDARSEGDPVALAEKRTLSYSNRKIVMGSTPVDESTSRILRAYEKSDQRIYECPCPHCGEFQEIKWADIRWEPDQPETAHWVCPSCGAVTEESGKTSMVHAGRWRATKPEVEHHHGYKINALVSLLHNTAWPKLAAEFLEAKRSPETLKAFTTTLLAEPWRDSSDEIDQSALVKRYRPHNLENMPADTLVLTAGVDLQDDRLEMSTVGFNADGDARVLAHEIVWGSALQDSTWQELDDLLKRQWVHPNGGIIRLDACVIDSGHMAEQVLAFTGPRTSRRIVAGKGVAGFHRPALAWSKTRRARLALLGVDGLKLAIHQRLMHGDTITISDKLGQDYLDQLAAETLQVRYSRGHPVRQWHKISGRANEALDTLAYALAARHLIPLDLSQREAQLSGKAAAKPVVVKSKWLEG
ncbi:MAG: phage terminase large subunit family protein [Rhodobacteraceae bacterium]|nr:phage terminase large subunit family protein [Paracoccaceae bacterium]